ncbi:MAG TPA: hypothetical protein VLB83_00910 [Candidatus Paceibacterota bacterium]|nr:hypothetical protein [Candidatus Paceibacterota bacterium]
MSKKDMPKEKGPVAFHERHRPHRSRDASFLYRDRDALGNVERSSAHYDDLSVSSPHGQSGSSDSTLF